MPAQHFSQARTDTAAKNGTYSSDTRGASERPPLNTRDLFSVSSYTRPSIQDIAAAARGTSPHRTSDSFHFATKQNASVPESLNSVERLPLSRQRRCLRLQALHLRGPPLQDGERNSRSSKSYRLSNNMLLVAAVRAVGRDEESDSNWKKQEKGSILKSSPTAV